MFLSGLVTYEAQSMIYNSIICHIVCYMDFLDGASVKNLLASTGHAREMGLIPGIGRSRGGGNSKPLHYSSWKIT